MDNLWICRQICYFANKNLAMLVGRGRWLPMSTPQAQRCVNPPASFLCQGGLRPRLTFACFPRFYITVGPYSKIVGFWPRVVRTQILQILVHFQRLLLTDARGSGRTGHCQTWIGFHGSDTSGIRRFHQGQGGQLDKNATSLTILKDTLTTFEVYDDIIHRAFVFWWKLLDMLVSLMGLRSKG